MNNLYKGYIMNRIQTELFKLLLSKKSKDELISLYRTVDYDIYRLIINSKLPKAEQFEKWLFEEVTPIMEKFK